MSQGVSVINKELDVAIVGGGVCGVCCAIALERRGIKARIHESAEKFGEIGAGLAFSPNALHILDALGVLKDVIGHNPLGDWNVQWRQGDGDYELIYELKHDHGEGHFAMHRAAFLDAVVKHVDPATVSFKKRCVSVTPFTTGVARYYVHFADGTTAEADVVLLANGINCAVRNAGVGTHETNFVTYVNKYCYRGLVPRILVAAVGLKNPELLSGTAKIYVGKDKHIIVFPIAGGKISSYWKDNLLSFLGDYSDFGADIRAILSCMSNPTRWNLTVVWPHLPTYVNGGIALLGDAAHAMLPHIGAGGSQGLEDAYLLAQLLSHPQMMLKNLDDVLRVYDEVRRPRS